MSKIVALILMWSMPVCLGWSFYAQTHYVNSRPTVADPQAGRTFALNVHGTTVYLTSAEYFSARRTFDIGLIVGVAGGLLWRREKKKRSGDATQIAH
jgi:hypothetical protein